jgi:ankyrin repeat protein
MLLKNHAVAVVLLAVLSLVVAAQVSCSADEQSEQAKLDARLFAALVNEPMDVGAVEALLKAGAGVNAMSDDGSTPLHWAAEGGSAELVTMLLKAGAEVNAMSNVGWTPLHSAAERGYAWVVTMLLEAGAEVNAKTNSGFTSGFTPLHFAAQSGDAELLTMLLKAGAKPRAADGKGRTPRDLTQDDKCREILWNAMMETPLK